MLKESVENIEQTILNLKKLKEILKKKQANLDYQIQQQKTKLSKEKEKSKLKHLKSKRQFNNY